VVIFSMASCIWLSVIAHRPANFTPEKVLSRNFDRRYGSETRSRVAASARDRIMGINRPIPAAMTRLRTRRERNCVSQNRHYGRLEWRSKFMEQL
jgi:hypothetical protein